MVSGGSPRIYPQLKIVLSFLEINPRDEVAIISSFLTFAYERETLLRRDGVAGNNGAVIRSYNAKRYSTRARSFGNVSDR